MKQSAKIQLMILALLLTMALGASTVDAQVNTNTSIDGIEQRNSSNVQASGSYTQNIIGQGQGSFNQGSIPTYERAGSVQCAVSSLSADAFALNNDASIGAFRVGVSIPLTFGRCRRAFDDEMAVIKYGLHVAKIEQAKQNILFQTKMADVCMGLHQAGIVIVKTSPLYQACLDFQPAALTHDNPHPAEPYIEGYGKPSAHKHERHEEIQEINIW